MAHLTSARLLTSMLKFEVYCNQDLSLFAEIEVKILEDRAPINISHITRTEAPPCFGRVHFLGVITVVIPFLFQALSV